MIDFFLCVSLCGGLRRFSRLVSVTRMSDVPLIQRRRRSSNVGDKRNGSSSLFQNSIQRCMIKPLHHLQTSITDERPPPQLVQINFCRRRSGWGRWTDLKTLQESSSLLCIHSLVLWGLISLQYILNNFPSSSSLLPSFYSLCISADINKLPWCIPAFYMPNLFHWISRAQLGYSKWECLGQGERLNVHLALRFNKMWFNSSHSYIINSEDEDSEEPAYLGTSARRTLAAR